MRKCPWGIIWKSRLLNSSERVVPTSTEMKACAQKTEKNKSPAAKITGIHTACFSTMCNIFRA